MKLGLLVDNLRASQLGYYVCKNTNAYLEQNPQADIRCYYESFEKTCMTPNFSTSNIIEAWDQKGPMLATTESTAQKLKNFVGTKQRFYYLWNLEWYNKVLPEDYVLWDSSIKLICRSYVHAQVIRNNFNREVDYVVDNFDIEEIMEIVNNDRIE